MRSPAERPFAQTRAEFFISFRKLTKSARLIKLFSMFQDFFATESELDWPFISRIEACERAKISYQVDFLP